MQNKLFRTLLNSTPVLAACGIMINLVVIPTGASGVGMLDITDPDGSIMGHMKHSYVVRLNGDTVFDGYKKGRTAQRSGIGVASMDNIPINEATRDGDILEIERNWGMVYDHKTIFQCKTPKTNTTTNYLAFCMDGSIELQYKSGR